MIILETSFGHDIRRDGEMALVTVTLVGKATGL